MSDEAFNDKDLECWKKEHKSPLSKALVARLEAAEVLASYAAELRGPKSLAVFKWRKSAGKE